MWRQTLAALCTDFHGGDRAQKSGSTFAFACPNWKNKDGCPIDKLYWSCNCGSAKFDTFSFKCCDPPPIRSDRPIERIRSISSSNTTRSSSRKEYVEEEIKCNSETNILLLGGTGVGKSTFINALIANYFTYDTLKKAEESELGCLIPTQFSVSDDDGNQIKVQTGKDSNENVQSGQSASQHPKAYNCWHARELLNRVTRMLLLFYLACRFPWLPF